MICAKSVEREICTPTWALTCRKTTVTVLEVQSSCSKGDLVLHTQAQLQAVIQQTPQTTQTVPQFEPATVAKVFSAGFGVVVLFFLVGRGVGQVLRLLRYG